MSNDIKAAETLGLTEEQLYTEVGERIGGPSFAYLSDGTFRPMKISKGSLIGFQEIADELGIQNPIDYVMDSIEELRASLSEYSLSNENIPNIKNPFDNLPKPNLGPVGEIPPNVANASGFVGQSNVSVPFTELNQDQQLDKIDKLFNN